MAPSSADNDLLIKIEGVTIMVLKRIFQAKKGPASADERHEIQAQGSLGFSLKSVGGVLGKCRVTCFGTTFSETGC